MDGNTILAQPAATRRRPFRSAQTAPPAFRRNSLGEIAAAFHRGDVFDRRAIDFGEVRRIRSLMASASEDSEIDPHCRDRLTQALRLLDAVLDSPLDLDAPLFEAIHVLLEPPLTREEEEQPEHTADLAEPALAAPCETVDLRQETPSSVRGYHVRQGGHDFVLPVDKIVGAFAADVDILPTVFGRTVVQFSGEICDVFRLATRFGLTTREGGSPKTLMVVASEGHRVCLAVDEVVGPVDASLAAIPSALPQVPGITGVALLSSGALALVPDLANLPGIPGQQAH